MVPVNADNAKIGGFPVATASGIPAEYGAAVSGGERFCSEDIAGIETGPVIQLEWIDAVETALRQLSSRYPEDMVLIEALAAAARLRTVVSASGTSGKSAATLWFCLYCCVSLPFLNHFSSAVGNDLGHAMAHQIVKVLSSMAHHLEL
jgi:hypothetical protein